MNILIFIFLTIVSSGTTTLNPSVMQWLDVALGYINQIKCDNAYFALQKQCQLMKLSNMSQMAIYYAKDNADHKVIATLPDGRFTRSGKHDAVLVIDPFPDGSVGHLVLTFFIDHLQEAACELSGGTFIASLQDCIRLAVKNHCNPYMAPHLERRRIRQAFQCEVDFIPSVFRAPERGINPPVNEPNILKCITIPANGFSYCPQLRPISETGKAECNLDCSSRRDEILGSRCTYLTICDHAIIIHGGWNRQTSRISDYIIFKKLIHTLIDNGFATTEIKSFFANGIKPTETDTQLNPDIKLLSVIEKSTFRRTIRNICQMNKCVDTLFISLRGPSQSDGSILLWDQNEDGKANDEEKYKLNEFLTDIQGCTAKQIIVIADFSYSGRLKYMLKNMKQQLLYSKVIAFTSTDRISFRVGNNFTAKWLTKQDKNKCTRTIFEELKGPASTEVEIDGFSLISGQPEWFDGSKGYLRTTFFGAPCQVLPPFTENELKPHLGCRRVPLPIWHQTSKRDLNITTQHLLNSV